MKWGYLDDKTTTLEPQFSLQDLFYLLGGRGTYTSFLSVTPWFPSTNFLDEGNVVTDDTAKLDIKMLVK